MSANKQILSIVDRAREIVLGEDGFRDSTTQSLVQAVIDMAEALEWYARESVYRRIRIKGKVDLLERGPDMDAEVCPVEGDAGQKARAVLRKWKVIE